MLRADLETGYNTEKGATHPRSAGSLKVPHRHVCSSGPGAHQLEAFHSVAPTADSSCICNDLQPAKSIYTGRTSSTRPQHQRNKPCSDQKRKSAAAWRNRQEGKIAALEVSCCAATVFSLQAQTIWICFLWLSLTRTTNVSQSAATRQGGGTRE